MCVLVLACVCTVLVSRGLYAHTLCVLGCFYHISNWMPCLEHARVSGLTVFLRLMFTLWPVLVPLPTHWFFFPLLMNETLLRDSLRAARPSICNAHRFIFGFTLNTEQLQPVNTAWNTFTSTVLDALDTHSNPRVFGVPGLKKRTRKAFGIRKKEKDNDSTWVPLIWCKFQHMICMSVASRDAAAAPESEWADLGSAIYCLWHCFFSR